MTLGTKVGIAILIGVALVIGVAWLAGRCWPGTLWPVVATIGAAVVFVAGFYLWFISQPSQGDGI